MALNQLFNSPLLSKSPKLRQNKISAAKISPLKSFKIDTDVLRAPSIPRPGEGVKEPNLILRELVETNTILREVQKQLAIDFANRILEKEKDLKLQKSLLAKRRGKDKEDSIEGKIGKDTSFLKKSFDKVTKPIKGIFDRIKDFLTALALAITASAAFEWLKDPANRERLENFFNWVGEHWKWIVGIIAGGLLLKGLLDILGALTTIAALAKGLGLGSGLRRVGTGLMDCFGVLACAPVASAVLSSAFFASLTSALMLWPWLKGLKDRVFDIPDWVRKPVVNPIPVFATQLADATKDILDTVDSRIKVAISGLDVDIPTVGVLATQFNAFKEWTTTQLQVLSNIGPKLDAWGENLQKSFVQFGEGFKVGFENAKQGLVDAFTTVVSSWENRPGWIDSALVTLGGIALAVAAIKLWPITASAAILGALGLGGGMQLQGAFADGGLVEKYAKGGPVRKKKPCCKSCMGFSAGKFEEGGKTKGPSHAQGGIPIEVEGGEFITKASSVNPLTEPLLRDINDNGARMWTAFAGAVEKQGQNNLKQMEINNDFSDFLKKYRNVAAGINPGAVHGMGGPSPDTPLKLKPLSSSTLTTGEQVPSELLELGTIWKDGILRHSETDKPFTYADLYKIIDSRVSNLSGEQIKVIPHRDSDTSAFRRVSTNVTVVDESNVDPAVHISREGVDTDLEPVQKRGSRGYDDIIISTFDGGSEWIIKTMDAYNIRGYVGKVI